MKKEILFLMLYKQISTEFKLNMYVSMYHYVAYNIEYR